METRPKQLIKSIDFEKVFVDGKTISDDIVLAPLSEIDGGKHVFSNQ